jgi:hypothetical protein
VQNAEEASAGIPVAPLPPSPPCVDRESRLDVLVNTAGILSTNMHAIDTDDAR